jgi:hypothetical protein
MPLRALRVSLDTGQSRVENLPAIVEQEYLARGYRATFAR